MSSKHITDYYSKIGLILGIALNMCKLVLERKVRINLKTVITVNGMIYQPVKMNLQKRFLQVY